MIFWWGLGGGWRWSTAGLGRLGHTDEALITWTRPKRIGRSVKMTVGLEFAVEKLVKLRRGRQDTVAFDRRR